MSKAEAYIHLVLALHYLGKPIEEETLKNVLNAIGVEVDEALIKVLVDAVKNVNLEELISQAAVPMVAAPAAAAPAEEKPAEEEKKEEEEEKKEEEAVAGLADLFGF